MSHGNGVVDGESLPAMVPDETANAVPCHLYPTSRIRDVVQDRNHRGAFALHDSSANGKAGEAPTKAQVSLAEYDADVSVVEAEAKARVAVAEALEAEAKAKAKAAVAKADAEARVAEAEATTKVRVAAAEALEADLKIVKLRKELEILTGQANEQADVEKVVEKPKKRARTGKPGTGAASVSKAVTNKSSEGLQIGQRIEVHFDDPPGYFPGTITGKYKGRWRIEYDDGYREELDLSTTGRMKRKYRLLRGEAAKGAAPGSSRSRDGLRHLGICLRHMGLTLLDLMKAGLMEPGQGVLRVECKGHVFLGDLTPSGSICYEGELFESPKSWSGHVKRSIVPGFKDEKNGWRSVFYVTEDGKKTTLDQLRKTHALKITGFASFEKETARRSPKLLDLMKEGLMEPGQGVLRVEYKGHVFLGDLTPSGSICYEGELFESPKSWSAHVKMSVVPSYKTHDSGWESVFYVTEDGEKTTLGQLRRTHALKLSVFGSYEKETASRGPTLLDLIKAGLMEPGQGVLRVEFKGHVFLGDLTPSGSICYKGKLWESPSGWSGHVKRNAHDSGWESVFYVTEDGEKTKLAQLRRTHALKISGFGSYEKETARKGLTLRDLMKEGLMEPGQGVLRVEYKGHVFLGDLTPSGSICYEGKLWESPSGWSIHVKRRVVPGMKGSNGWESVFYVTEDGEKTTLAQLRRTHALKISGFGSIEKETATAPKVKSELAARAPAAELAECCPAHRHQAQADHLGGLK
ncbi:MPN domain-containing protein [Chloropicon roscoffensis]|uniref:MPN domain-containing protein n=1 Tax=Chloropicon roscoffensis TaxID=1461544 RepID=A0AAX4PBN1_9CHLO